MKLLCPGAHNCGVGGVATRSMLFQPTAATEVKVGAGQTWNCAFYEFSVVKFWRLFLLVAYGDVIKHCRPQAWTGWLCTVLCQKIPHCSYTNM